MMRLCLLLLFAAPLVAQEEPLPFEQEQVQRYDYKRQFIKMILCTGGVLGLVGVTAFYMKRMGRGGRGVFNQNARIKILERRALSPKTAVYLLEVGGKNYLVGDGPNGVNSLFAVESDSQPQDHPFSRIFRAKIAVKK